MAKDLFSLPPPERLKRYRELAAEAQAFSNTMIKREVREGYLTIARHWTELADQLEKSMHTGMAEAPERPKPDPAS